MNDYHALEPCVVRALTDKAALVLLDGGTDEHWIPFSLIHEDDLARARPGTEFDALRVERWFCEREGIE